MFRGTVICASFANYWYWLALPMPAPPPSEGMTYEYFGRWLAAMAMISFLAGCREKCPAIAAATAGFGSMIGSLLYIQLGLGERWLTPAHFRWDGWAEILLVPAAVLYLVVGAAFAFLPAIGGFCARQAHRALVSRRLPPLGDSNS